MIVSADAPDLSDVSVVVLSYNRIDVIERNLTSLVAELKDTACELIVVDNASTDGSAEVIADIATSGQIKFLKNDRNHGVSEGRNIGWRESTRKFILSIDDDIVMSASAILLMKEAAIASASQCLVSPSIIDSITGQVINRKPPKGSRSSFYEACFLLPSTIIDRVGYLDEALAVAGEGLDYSIRLRRAGFQTSRLWTARVTHVDRVRSGPASSERRRMWLWSFCYVYWKNMSVPSALWHSLRVLAAHARVGVRLFGWSFVASLPSCAIAGAREGAKARSSQAERASASPAAVLVRSDRQPK